MAQVLVRNLDDDVVARLKAQAANENLSLEQFLRNLLTRSTKPKLSKADYFAAVAAIRATVKPGGLDPTDLIREDRDTDHGRGGPDAISDN